MQPAYPVTAQVLAQRRLDNALSLFEEFVRATARHADAATLRGLEGRFAERVLIQPSYWSQIKSRSRQIGERLARQFEQRCNKPVGWMDLDHRAADAATRGESSSTTGAKDLSAETEESPATPRDDDERFMVGLVLSYYRRHPQRAKARLLELLGEVLTPAPTSAQPVKSSPKQGDDAHEVWLRSQKGVAPLKTKKR